jgi:hypothetical protein
VVRQLAQPLNAAERHRVREFANSKVGQSLNGRANVLMTDPRASRLQRFNCLGAVLGRGYERSVASMEDLT